MILNEEQRILKARGIFEEMAARMKEAAEKGEPIGTVEQELWEGMLRMSREFLQGYATGQGTGDLGETLPYEGRTLRRLERLHTRRYVSVFGELEIPRTVYGTRESKKIEVAPLDARLTLPEGDFSYLLQRWDQGFCVEESYQQSAGKVEEILGIGQSVRTLEHGNRTMAADVEGFQASLPPPPPEDEGSILVMTADGKGVPMALRELAETERTEEPKRRRRGKGEKAQTKREACVGAVYSIEPHRRTAEDVVDEVARRKAKSQRPKPQHKRVRAALTRPVDGEEVSGKEDIFCWFEQEIERRDPKAEKTLVCLLDGDRALWRKLEESALEAVGVLDLFHVLERLWDLAHCFHKEGSEEAEAFVTERLRRLLEGDVGRVIGGLKQMATKNPLKKSCRKRFEKALNYLENNREHMAYDDYLAKGYPIGSGVAEGACRHLVKDRMERTGMRWKTPGAQAMLDLRAVYLNGHWDAFHQYRIQKHQKRLYPYRHQILAQWKAAA